MVITKHAFDTLGIYAEEDFASLPKCACSYRERLVFGSDTVYIFLLSSSVK